MSLSAHPENPLSASGAPQDLAARFGACSREQQLLVCLLALNDEPLSKVRLLDLLRKASARSSCGEGTLTAISLGETLSHLQRRGLLEMIEGRGWSCVQEMVNVALHHCLADDSFNTLCAAIDAEKGAHHSWYGPVHARSYRQAVARLRIALLRGQGPEEIYAVLTACTYFVQPAGADPFIDSCSPFDPALFARLHPLMQEEAMLHLLSSAWERPESARPLFAWTSEHLARVGAAHSILTSGFATHHLLTGELDAAWQLVHDDPRADSQFVRASVLLLRNDLSAALEGYAVALKNLRKVSGKRTTVVGGVCGYLYVLAQLRASDPKATALAQTYLDYAFRSFSNAADTPFFHLEKLLQAQAGSVQAEEGWAQPGPGPGPNMLPTLFKTLYLHWTGAASFESQRPALAAILARARTHGFGWIEAQAAALLGRMGDAAQKAHGAAMQQALGLSDMADWFLRQASWERQLTALTGLRQAAATAQKSDSQIRLVWLLAWHPGFRGIDLEPREQKRDAKGGWTKGRAVALKRLFEEKDQMAWLSAQDRRTLSNIRAVSTYRGVAYELDTDRAMSALCGHPLVFWMDAPTVQVEVLAGQPELLVRESAGQLLLQLQPAIDASDEGVLISKETPTRLRIVTVEEEHRRIAAIVGAGMSVPLHAKEQVLQALRTVSSLMTVQSDIGGGADNIEQIDADPRLQVHLLPYRDGLKMQILAKPFVDGGPCYAPGMGSESVLAEIGGKAMQARRDLAHERTTEQTLISACPVLGQVTNAHGEWLIDEPELCLELLAQLQALADAVVIAWPEGEKFRLSASLGAGQMSLSARGEGDWFSVGGELRVDESTVLNLRQLLELVRQGKSRFLALDGQRFLALTSEFHRRLTELAAYTDPHGEGARVHPLAAFSLEELANDSGDFKADKKWKQHLERLKQLDTLTPEVPATLQTELRDYQLEGFGWLMRLAHWGVGACLADDMGLGKTVQALALLLARAPQGPALVVAPTSVCMNWISETARFAPTLKTALFGGTGDRSEMLQALGNFDLVIVSYGLLQQEAERFAAVQWHTIVLDEAQAIKNAATKRSHAVMALQGSFRMAVTGTPLENHLGELWNLFRFINPGLLGSADQFQQRYAQPIERSQDAEARARLRRLIRPFMLRRTKTQVLAELPSRTEIVREVNLSADEAALYESIRRSALERLAMDGPATQKSLQILAEIMKLRRACCHPQLVAPELGLASSKLAAFGLLLDELLENRHKALVFSQFVDHLGLIRQYLDKRGVAYQYLDGATPMQERKKRVDAFQAGSGDVFLISLKAGGTGLNLTAADYVIHMDPWWNPAVEDQASDRAHRMGQQRPVTIYRLVTKHTIEESIIRLHRHKRDLADSLLEGSEMASKMSAQDMLRLLEAEADLP